MCFVLAGEGGRGWSWPGSMKTDLLYGVTPDSTVFIRLKSTQWSNDIPAFIEAYLLYTATSDEAEKLNSHHLGLAVFTQGVCPCPHFGNWSSDSQESHNIKCVALLFYFCFVFSPGFEVARRSVMMLMYSFVVRISMLTLNVWLETFCRFWCNHLTWVSQAFQKRGSLRTCLLRVG